MNESEVLDSWISGDALAGADVPAVLHSWLVERGSLTRRLSRTARRFALQLVDESHIELSPTTQTALSVTDTTGLIRRVRLLCDDIPRVYAETIIPRSTLERHAWLNDLGANPLGANLFEREGVERSEFEYVSVSSGTPLFERAANGSGDNELWVRRSLFLINGDPLLVDEVFLPAIGELDT